jgi:hypothetical protein
LSNENNKVTDSETWARDVIKINLQFILDSLYSRNQTEHQKDAENISMVKARLISKIEWLHESIPIQDLKIHKKINLNDLHKSSMSNLYMLETQLTIMKKYRMPTRGDRTIDSHQQIRDTG